MADADGPVTADHYDSVKPFKPVLQVNVSLRSMMLTIAGNIFYDSASFFINHRWVRINSALASKVHYWCSISHSNRTEKWVNIECNDLLPVESYVELKREGDSKFVYCLNQRLEVTGHNLIVCANAVYQFSCTVSSFIHGKLWEVTKTIILLFDQQTNRLTQL